jgi:hypothetical protein
MAEAEADRARLTAEISRLTDELEAQRQKEAEHAAARANWDVMGDFVHNDLNLSGLSSDPPPRPLPDAPHGPPNRPLPALKGCSTSGSGPWSKDAHAMNFRIGTEAVATMRGVNTLLAILQARNDAAEAKIRNSEDMVSERDSRIAMLLLQQVPCTCPPVQLRCHLCMPHRRWR